MSHEVKHAIVEKVIPSISESHNENALVDYEQV